MSLDGIVLDLDDTLYDTTALLLPWADRRAVAAMRASGLALAEDEALARLALLRGAGEALPLGALARACGAGEDCAAAGESAWFEYDPPPMRLDEETARALDDLARLAPLALLTSGHPPTQRRKVERLGIAERFVEIRIADFRVPGAKTVALGEILAARGWRAPRVVLCGDRPDGDVRAANRNGCRAVLLRRAGGEMEHVAPQCPDDVPWRTIARFSELPALLRAE
jgi:FMN phosphatase YigB (HAD superfamily)